MSSKKTPNLGLHEWVPDDYVLMEEFNDNFKTLDDHMGGIRSEVTELKSEITEIEQTMTENKQEVMSRLDDTTEDVFTGKVNNKTIEYAAVFIDDDGRNEVLTKLKPIFDQYNVPLTIAAISGLVGTEGFMTQAQLKSLESQGWEIASHTVTHANLANADEDKIAYEVGESKKQLEAMGFTIKNFVYPFGATNLAIRNALRKYGYNCAPEVIWGINKIPVDRYRLKRFGMGSYFDGANGEHPTNSVEYYKSKVDEAKNEKGLVIFKLHCWNEDHDETQNEYVRQTVAYCIEQGVPVLTLQQAMQHFDNLVETGDVTGTQKNTRIATDGTFRSTDVPSLFTKDIPSLSKVPQEYELNKVTVQQVASAQATGFPLNAPGTLITSVIGAYDWAYQLFIPIRRNEIYKREWMPGSQWSEFSRVSNNDIEVRTTLNAITSSHTSANLPQDKITLAHSDIAGGANYPNQNAGTIQSVKLGNAGWWYEIFKEYNNNKIHVRGTDKNGDFLPFDELARKNPTTSYTVNAGTVNGNFSHDYVTTYQTNHLHDLPLISTNKTLPIGITFCAYVNTGRYVVIRLSNATVEPIEVGDVPFRISTINAR